MEQTLREANRLLGESGAPPLIEIGGVVAKEAAPRRHDVVVHADDHDVVRRMSNADGFAVGQALEPEPRGLDGQRRGQFLQQGG